MSEPRFPLVIVDVAESEAEEASAALFELGASGVEERDETTLVKGAAGKVTLLASFADVAHASAALVALPPCWSPRESAIVGDAWRDDWKKYFHPFEVCPGIVVRPPWEAYQTRPGQKVLELEPGRAFGTGLHETTSLVAEALRELAPAFSGRPILDVGCGSGILSLIALTLGASSARAVDTDPDAVAVTRENAMRNAMSGHIYADTTDVVLLSEQYPVVVANIEAGTLAAMAPALTLRMEPSGLLVLSGILAPEVAEGQIEEVRHAYRALAQVSERIKGQWASLVLRKP